MTRVFGPQFFWTATIGGRGFWLVRDAEQNAYGSITDGWTWDEQYNTNTITQRTAADACEFNINLPDVGTGAEGRLEFYHLGLDIPAVTQVAPATTYEHWQGIAYTAGHTDLILGGRSVRGHFDDLRHIHRVLYENTSGSAIVSAERIPLGDLGYTDTMPGLFRIKPVADSLVPGISCSVIVEPADNSMITWQDGYDTTHRNVYQNFGTVGHPYLKDETAAVEVDLSDGNANKNVIPGIVIEFDTNMTAYSEGIVAVGFEYCNGWSDVGDLGDIDGRATYYSPRSCYGPMIPGQAIGGRGAKGAPFRWQIYNVTGEVQTGCKFHIGPLVRVSQADALSPFAQWFMGYDNDCELAKQQAPYAITFSNLVSWTPTKTVTLACNGTVDMAINEIDPDTYLATGTVHADASLLKCDGITLYRWDALGIYFVLAADVSVSSTASLYVRNGDVVEQRIRLDVAQSGGSYLTVASPTTHTIGGWDVVTDESGNHYPLWAYAAEAQFNGKIQSQGYDFEFFNSVINPTNQHWYNHDFEVPTYPALPSDYPYSEMGELAVWVTCDDPRYFQVVPITFLPIRLGGAAGMSAVANIAKTEDEVEITAAANIIDVEASLTVRVEQISSGFVILMDECGIELKRE